MSSIVINPNRPMSAQRFRAALDKLQIDQNAFSRFIRVDRRTVRRWLGNERPIPAAVALLVSVMVKKKVSPYEASLLAKVAPRSRSDETWEDE